MSLNSLSYLVGVLALVTVVAVALGAIAMVRARRFEQKWTHLLTGSSGNSLEAMLHEHSFERKDTLAKLAVAEARIAELEMKMATSKRHVGLVRYDAFEEVGGSQSFAIAIYDDLGDGAVINSLVGRADCRVYGKALNRGRSERSLSREEQLAIDEAAQHDSKPLMSS